MIRNKLWLITQQLNRWISWVAAILLFIMMLLTFIDVVGRTFLNMPIMGGFELTELMLAALIFLALPIVTAENSHVEVDLLDRFIPIGVQKFQRFIIKLINIVAFAILGWMLFEHTVRAYQYNDVTSVLEIPFTSLGVVMVVGCFLTLLSLLLAPSKKETVLTEEDMF